jgi:pyruvate dehydrogenase E1 component alpha subunit
MGDAEGYRPEGEKDHLFEKDPIPAMRKRLLADGDASDADLDGIETRAHSKVEAAIAFARDSSYAPETDALTSVFA